MGEVAANAAPFAVRIPGGFGRAGVLVAEGDAVVDVIADRLDQRPSLGDFAELRPRDLDEAIGFAITAAHEIDQRLDRQLLQRMLLGVRRDLVRRSGVPDQKVRGQREPAFWGVDHVAGVAEAVAIPVGGNERIEPHPIRREQVGNARGMHAQRQDHGRRLRTFVGNFVAGANLHHKTLRLAALASGVVSRSFDRRS